MNSFKKIIIFCITICTALSLNVVRSFASDSTQQYRNALIKINHEYGTNIEFGSVDTTKVSLSDYETTAREIAAEQKALEEYIHNRNTYKGKQFYFDTFAKAKKKTKTVTKDASGWNGFKISATYDVTGTKISNPRSIKVKQRVPLLSDDFTPYSGPSSKIIDSGRTLTVTFVGSVWRTERDHQTGATSNYTEFKNIKLYSEFYYDS